ncbi:MAG: hypothetical protein IPP51_00120 [Bacteroidetes bacterium]|nr:hypothetical protein [Bacteroidota bacterium]
MKSVFAVWVSIMLLSMSMVRFTPVCHYRTLSFFFDGVPDPNKKEDTTLIVSSDTSLTTLSQKKEPDSYDHKPYAEDMCESCHERGFSNRLLVPQPDLCYTCHTDFTQKYQALHGPVASGNCTACHNQHTGKYRYLLDRKGQDVCLYCHESRQVFANKLHKEIGEKNCTECHSPHGGDNRGMLRQSACVNCHESFDTKFTFLHGPVASGNCTACHSSHASKSPKLQLREGQQICLYCHNSDQVFKNEAHKKAKKMNCTECHNPHGGADRYILVSALRPIKKPAVKTDTGVKVEIDSTKTIEASPVEQETPSVPADSVQSDPNSPQRKIFKK